MCSLASHCEGLSEGFFNLSSDIDFITSDFHIIISSHLRTAMSTLLTAHLFFIEVSYFIIPS